MRKSPMTERLAGDDFPERSGPQDAKGSFSILPFKRETCRKGFFPPCLCGGFYLWGEIFRWPYRPGERRKIWENGRGNGGTFFSKERAERFTEPAGKPVFRDPGRKEELPEKGRKRAARFFQMLRPLPKKFCGDTVPARKFCAKAVPGNSFFPQEVL